MLESHYAPSKPLRLLTKRVAELNENDLPTLQALIKNTPPQDPIGLLLMGGTPESLSSGFSQLVGRSIVARTLSPTEDLQEAARNLFSEMRWLDDSPVSLIFAEFCFPNQGLGYAISDRLRRASTR
jgi:L-threonylcarbamoyladenylate synthase